MLITKKRLDKGIRRLMGAPKDLSLSGAPVIDEEPHKPSARHRKLFNAYVKDINKQIPPTLEWWSELADEAREGGDEMSAWRTRPAGPASDPCFISLVRKYWLACAALNDETPEPEAVAPEVLLLKWLVD